MTDMHHHGDFVLDADRRTIIGPSGKECRMRPMQVTILQVLMRRRVAHRETILDAIWGDRSEGPSPQIVNVQMTYLRRLLREAGSSAVIRSHHKIGYELSVRSAPPMRVLTPEQSDALDRLLEHARSHCPSLAAQFCEVLA